MSKSNYEKYKELKSQFDFEYRGFNMGQIMAIDLITYAYQYSQPTVIQILKNCVKYYDLKSFINSFEASEYVTYSIDRKDYKELINKYIQKLELKDFEVKMISKVAKIKINPLSFLRSIKRAFKINIDIPFKDKLYFTSLETVYKNTIEDLLDSNIKLPKTYYAFNSAYLHETLLTLYFKQKGVLTYSFQHGFDYLKKPYLLNVINYENSVADKILCWGQYTIDQMKEFGINENKLILFGNPKYDKIKKYKKRNEKFNKALVILSRYMFEKGNNQLLNILSKFQEIKFYIKLHPTLDMEKYEQITKNTNNLILKKDNTLITELFMQDFDFVVTYNSSVHYESLYNGFLTFGYFFENDGAILFENFRDNERMKVLINRYEKKIENDVAKKIEEFAKYTMSNKNNK